LPNIDVLLAGRPRYDKPRYLFYGTM